MALITSDCACRASWASNGPNYLGLCVSFSYDGEDRNERQRDIDSWTELNPEVRVARSMSGTTL